jgi:hypothetical protein
MKDYIHTYFKDYCLLVYGDCNRLPDVPLYRTHILSFLSLCFQTGFLNVYYLIGLFYLRF